MNESSDELSYSTLERPGNIGTLYRLAQDQFNAGIVDSNSMSPAAAGRSDFAEEGVDSLPYQAFSALPYSIPSS